MYTVDVNVYPKNKEWNQKINSTPSIPGGKNNVLENLRTLLLEVEKGNDFDIIPSLLESSSNSTLKDLCVHQLSPMNFVNRTKNGWELSDEARVWIESEDNMYLAAYFCANVKFFAEILFYLDSPKTSRELFNIAVNEYDLTWKVISTINNRLVWLRQFGLVDFQEFSLLYSITEKGKQFLQLVKLVMPENIISAGDETKSEKSIEIDSRYIEYYTENRNISKKPNIGYYLGKFADIDYGIASLLSQIKTNGDIEAINEYTKEKYNIKDSSTRSALNSLSALGLIERKTNTTYEVTDLGMIWLSDQNLLSLLPLFHMNYLFFFEILVELKDKTISSKELATIGKVSYGLVKDSVFEINKRTTLLKQSKLIINVTAEKWTLTNRGLLFLETYGAAFGLIDSKKQKEKKDTVENADIISQLRIASKDSYNPAKFEKVIRDYFEIIGFNAEWLGGSGKTDVLLKTDSSPLDCYVVTVDAKSTSSNVVTDSLVDFDTLLEHKRKHNSNYMAIVGRDFNERLIKRAEEHNVALFDLESLEQLLLLHKKTPLKTTQYRKIFEQSGNVDLSVLTKDINDKEHTGTLITEIMSILINECGDPITKGRLTVRDLYMSLRGISVFSSTPNTDEIKTVLDFLVSPIVGCVLKERDYYYAAGSLKDLSQALRYLEEKCFWSINKY